jgi:hypothetical protein
MTLNVMSLIVTLNKNETQHNNAQHNVLLNVKFFIAMLSVIMLNDVTLNIYVASLLMLMALR